MKLNLFLTLVLAIFGLSGNAQNSWSSKANFAGVARTEAAGFAIGNKCYIGTGWDNNLFVSYNDFWEWTPGGNGVWTQKANVPGPTRYGAVGFSIDTKGYIGTGRDLTNAVNLNDFYEYNPSNNMWTQKTNFAGVIRFMAVGFSIGNKGYIGTGTSGSGYYYNDFYECCTIPLVRPIC